MNDVESVVIGELYAPQLLSDQEIQYYLSLINFKFIMQIYESALILQNQIKETTPSGREVTQATFGCGLKKYSYTALKGVHDHRDLYSSRKVQNNHQRLNNRRGGGLQIMNKIIEHISNANYFAALARDRGSLHESITPFHWTFRYRSWR
ncbi:hypothetical protein MUCCIDRAFT_83031 [Mucor lusitanicus CBS 277.49]|uniref:Uncharacterized protein n=1 Tax=Mucor lusitanicus CBS 277.49 TaxID=747725 RepID=A0A168KQB5_MUCCL|nr:hypothetical protein MUCCIDRAFT_83031 [Mucor lusitanicus CBS 277.49]